MNGSKISSAETVAPVPFRTRVESWLIPARLYSGLILFAYVLPHLLTHATGLISLPILIEAGESAKSVIRNPLVSYLLYGALLVHVMASLWKVYQRRTLKMAGREWVQLILGLSIPLLLLNHVLGTRYAAEFYGINDGYAYVLVSIAILSPINGWLNVFGLLAAWIHSCIGLHMWFQTTAWYGPNWRSAGLVCATLIPVVSLAGFLAASRAIQPLWMDGEWRSDYFEVLNVKDDAVWTALLADIDVVRNFVLAILVLILIARIVRYFISLKNNDVRISYIDGPSVQRASGATLLEISKQSNIPHASVCGGRGRCSTCRVKVISADPELPPASDQELKVLSRIRAPSDVRLACQLIPMGQVEVMRLLPADATRSSPSQTQPWSTGQEKTVAILFADLRNFTKTSETKLPFDVVYLINQFSRAMGRSVEENNGRVDKFLGDGLMAIFGVDDDPASAARSALAAASEMIAQLDVLNAELGGDLEEPLRMGIGIHSGSVILGNMGYGEASGLTAIGDTVNAASRLEATTKQKKCVLCVSAELIELAGMGTPDISTQSVSIRGRKAKMNIFAIDHPNELKAAPIGQTG